MTPRELPDVAIDRTQRIRFAVVALFMAFSVLRVAPDAIRAIYPLNVFGYATDAAGVVDWVSPTPAIPYRDILRKGDRIVIGRVPPFDRKPGLVGTGYSRDNPVHRLAVARDRRIAIMEVGSRSEGVASRAMAAIRVLAFLVSLGLAAMLYLLQPSIATLALFVFCLGTDAPTTFSEVVLDNPWQQLPVWIGDVLHGCLRPALLAFACTLVWPRGPLLRAAAIGCAVAAVLLGNFNAYIDWLATYAGTPQPAYFAAYVNASSALTIAAVALFAVALVRASARRRLRIGAIVGTFALAGFARLLSDAEYPAHVAPWQNGILLSLTVLPIVAVWYSVLRHRFYRIDFVVQRAIVYFALTGAVVGAITLAEEVGTYVFYQNTDLAYGFIIIISTLLGSTTGKLRELIEKLVDRFVFRDRHERSEALAYISGYVLDAESPEDVYRALLEDVTHALSLDFSGVLVRGREGDFELARECGWPRDFTRSLPGSGDIVRAISRSRATLEFDGKTRAKDLASALSPRLSLAAPLFAERSVTALVVYGRNISGLRLDGHERERLARLVAHASLALASIELANARAELVAHALVAVEPRTPEGVGERGEG